MTEIFHYDELTWPEIAELPRDTPLIIPLGDYLSDQIKDAFNNPIQIGLLPSIPFGWEGSDIQVPDHIMAAMIDNLIDSLHEDGFTQVYSLLPDEIALETTTPFIKLACSTAQPTHPVLNPADSGKVILIPIGHTEQHGYHLPMSTDTLIIEAIAAGTVRAAPRLSAGLPVMPYGVSTHRSSFAGTLNCGGRAFEDFWLCVIDELVKLGYEHFYLLSGHGGNCSFLVNVTKYAGERHKGIFCATSWLYLSGATGIAALEMHRQSPIGGMGHACELETSLILFLHPELVYMERAVDEMGFIATPSYYMDWVEGGALIANPPWDDDSKTGAYGAGSLGSAEKGQRWLEAAIEEKLIHVSEILEQQTRRKARRESGYGLWGKN